MIKVENLNKSFDGVQVLKNINVEYEAGQCNMIIGASGSGKTVLLKNLIGLMEPDSGEICYGDRRFSQMGYKEISLLRQSIGVLFQGSALFDFATVIENVMFPMDFFTEWSDAQKKERAHYCLEKVNVTGADDKYPNELSGGMQKRVGIARPYCQIWNTNPRNSMGSSGKCEKSSRVYVWAYCGKSQRSCCRR